MFKKIPYFISAILLYLILYTSVAFAQKLEYGIKYEGIGDNREYFSKYHEAETILGSRLAGTIGFTTDSIHKFRTGFSYFYEYGSEIFELKPKLIMYYAYQKDLLTFKMGAIPRKESINFPTALISSKYEYYNPTIDGILIQFKNENSKIGTVVDWVSRQDTLRREQFLAGFFGEQRVNKIIFEEYAYMFHNAHRGVRLPGENIEDFAGACLMVGYDFSSYVPLDELTLKSGVLNSIYRDRGNGSDFSIKNSSYTEFKADYKGYGIEAFLKFGNQHQNAFASAFYNNAENYIRTKFYITPINFKRIKGQFSWSIHIANGDLDNQQQFRLIYLINEI